MKRKIEAISVMLSAFPASPGTDVDVQIRAYALAVDEIDVEAVVTTAKRVISGTVPGLQKRFAPSAAEFAEACRDREYIAKLMRDREARAKLPAPPPDTSPRVSGEKLQSLVDVLAGRISWADFGARWKVSK